jgi:hypothetical protein
MYEPGGFSASESRDIIGMEGGVFKKGLELTFEV